MASVKRTGPPMSTLIESSRELRTKFAPYAAATALTRAASFASKIALPDEMRRVFDRPTPYALNSLTIVAATKDKLVARVLVKNTRTAGGVRPESFLFPEVAGGSRSDKRFERALRYAGLLKPGEQAIPGKGIKLDGYGNVSGAQTRSILNQLGRKKTRVFFGQLNNKQGTRGIWERKTGGGVRSLFIVTGAEAHWQQRLDFADVVRRAAADQFRDGFNNALQQMLARASK